MPQLDPSFPVSPALSPVTPLESIREELERIPEEEVMAVRLDVTAASLTAVGAVPEIVVHRPAIAEVFGEEGTRAVDRIETLARALTTAHADHLAVTSVDLEPMAEAVVAERTTLLLALRALVERGVLDRNALDHLIGGQAYAARIADVRLLVSIARAKRHLIAGHTTLSEVDLQRAEEVNERFATALGRRDRAEAGSSSGGRLRARAFTLFFRTYDRVRQMLSYLRWHQDDVDRIAPSLYAGKSRSRSDAPDAPPPRPANPIPPGMPGADPFIRTP